MKTAILLPGIGGSGAAHWQTMWERADPSLIRFDPADWDLPDLDDWLAALDRAIDATDEPPILIAHSLACLLVAHWAPRPGARTIRGAFLVAAPDPDGPAFPASHAASFRDVPDAPLAIRRGIIEAFRVFQSEDCARLGVDGHLSSSLSWCAGTYIR